MGMESISDLNDETVRNMSIAAVFSYFDGKINSIDFYQTDDLLVTVLKIYHGVVSLCMSPTNYSFMSGSLDHAVRMWDLQGPFGTFLVGGDTAEVCDIEFSNDDKSLLLTTTNNNIYVLDAYCGEKRCGFSLEPSPNVTVEAIFIPDGQYVISCIISIHIPW